ncbi:MAG: hypothetical protein KGH98_03635 [Candidatus Micrarchaeota archaeon]|nr:hypothetical protein [Candidatus Micrarchaeota archaeon]
MSTINQNQRPKELRIEGKSADVIAKKIGASLIEKGQVKGNIILWKSDLLNDSGHVDYTIFADEKGGRRSVKVVSDEISIRKDYFQDEHFAFHNGELYRKMGMIYMAKDRAAYHLHDFGVDPQMHDKYLDIDVKKLIDSGKLSTV